MLRRDPATILVAHRMDAGRRELYVEGVRDRVFLNWLVGEARYIKASIVTIDVVEMPLVGEGGNRERLKAFLEQIASEPVEIRGLLDADQAFLVNESVPENAWLTDLRDAEGYVLLEENVDAALRLGCGIERVPAAVILASMHETARSLACVRLVSSRLALRLPIADAKLKKHVEISPAGQISLDLRGLLRGLLQAARVNLQMEGNVTDAVDEARQEIASAQVGQIIHGKDCMKLLTLQFRSLGATDITDVAPLLWSSFRRDKLREYPILGEVVTYLMKS